MCAYIVKRDGGSSLWCVYIGLQRMDMYDCVIIRFLLGRALKIKVFFSSVCRALLA